MTDDDILLALINMLKICVTGGARNKLRRYLFVERNEKVKSLFY